METKEYEYVNLSALNRHQSEMLKDGWQVKEMTIKMSAPKEFKATYIKEDNNG